ncbi:hypothetical protein N6H14_09220 [Paenibacillus sp. CC-CFT747]|nr:hypothetical protein N6H14_09220 [Paenibacillus sp. CC-CFT747]
MTLAAEVMLRGQAQRPLDDEEQYRLIALLMDELLQGLPSPVHLLLEAASVYGQFNEERLAAILETNAEPDTFRLLTALPFIIRKEDGWMLHDSARAWALEDLIRRKPQAYDRMRRKALDRIRLEEQAAPHLRQKLHMDRMSLHESPLVRHICFSSHLDEVELRVCRECDLPAMEALCLRYHQYSSPTVPEERHMAGLLRPIWKADPTSFTSIWKQNELVAFYGKVPLHDAMLPVLAGEPLLEPLLRGCRRGPNAFLLSFIGIEPELEENTRASVVNTMVNHFSLSDWILDFTCLREWFPVFELCGFERAPWADAVTVHGTEYRAFVLDLTKEDFITKLDRLLPGGGLGQDAMEKPHPPRDVPELKKILANWPQLHRNPLLAETYARLFQHRLPVGDREGTPGHTVQKDLLEAIHRLTSSDGREAILGKLLTSTYIKGIRPHEKVAERLGLSNATYYRYLNKALERLYDALSEET